MSETKAQASRVAKVILVLGVFAAIAAVIWMQGSDEKAAEDTAAQSKSASVSSAWKQELIGEPVPEEQATQIASAIMQARSDLSITNIRYSNIAGVYKANLQGRPVFFSADGRFFIVGEMYEVTDDSLVNLEEEERRNADKAFAPERAKMLSAIAPEAMVIFPATGNTRAHVYVFTDIDCGYCRKLHRQMPEMQAQGIEVRYLAFPRAGASSKSADKLATVWCADDPLAMMTRFKQGENVTLAPCEPNPVAEQYALGQTVGVRGTPAIVLASGQLIPGAVSTQQLLNILKEADLYP